jgi:hypothetical protein
MCETGAAKGYVYFYYSVEKSKILFLLRIFEFSIAAFPVKYYGSANIL